MNPAQREAYYQCRCGAARWEFLCTVEKCRHCDALVAPASEEIMADTVVAQYRCGGEHAWTRIFDIRRTCNACGAVDMRPESRPNRPIGVAVGRCATCEQYVHELNGSAASDVFCRTCHHHTPAIMVCSPRKFTQWARRMAEPQICAELSKALYLPARRRVVRTAAREPSQLRNLFDALPGAV